MLHFAYGSNMSREPMRQRCPEAQAIGKAILRRHRFVIMSNGYASVVPASFSEVHGILWRITPRDLAALDAYENVAGGLYRRVMRPVVAGGRSLQALVYFGAEKREGDPRTGYMELVVQAARENELPKDYIESLERLLPGRSNLGGGTGDRI
jgi:gamma-glutamylcyclotransferase (GGCT)/AIG2-like uncharacterized protein YtfP